MVPEFEEKMGSTPVGDVSEPFRTKFGWHILTVTGKHAPGTRTLDEAKEDLGKSLARSKQMQAVKQMIDDARTSMKIEVLLPEPKLPAPTPGAPAPIPAAPPAASNPEAPAPSGATAGAETKEST